MLVSESPASCWTRLHPAGFQRRSSAPGSLAGLGYGVCRRSVRIVPLRGSWSRETPQGRDRSSPNQGWGFRVRWISAFRCGASKLLDPPRAAAGDKGSWPYGQSQRLGECRNGAGVYARGRWGIYLSRLSSSRRKSIRLIRSMPFSSFQLFPRDCDTTIFLNESSTALSDLSSVFSFVLSSIVNTD